MARLTVIAILRARSGKENELQDFLHKLVGLTRQEAGCIDYDLHRRQDDPSVFVMLENWTAKAELDKHLQMPYMLEFAAALPDLLRSPVEMQLLDMLSSQQG